MSVSEPTLHLTNPARAPLPTSFQKAISDATDRAFVGRAMITTCSGETVLRVDVEDYNRRAEGPLASAFERLTDAGHDDVSNMIQGLYPRLIACFTGSGTINPVHHTAYVLECMVTILTGEGRTDKRIVTVGMLAALFHDVAQGLSKLKKITENNLKDKCLDIANGREELLRLKEYLDDAVRARREHMLDGARIAAHVLSEFRAGARLSIPDEYVHDICRIVAHHDDPKIPVAYRVIASMFAKDPVCQRWRSRLPSEDERSLQAILAKDGREYLFDVYDWLLQCHHEADLLWMLTPDGIDADLARFSPAEGKTARKLVDNNIREHHREVEPYHDLLEEDRFQAYGFREETAYRTATGYGLFQYLTRILKAKYPMHPDIEAALEPLSIVQAGRGVRQNEWHKHDVYDHTVAVVRILEDLNASRELIAVGWLHDVGKPVTKKPKTNKQGAPLLDASGNPYHSFPDHEERGEEMVRNRIEPRVFHDLGLNQDRVARIVGFHFLPMGRIKAAKENRTFEFFRDQVNQLSRELDETGMPNEVLTIFYADKMSQQPSDLPFLLALWNYLLAGAGNLESLFGDFRRTYPIKGP